MKKEFKVILFAFITFACFNSVNAQIKSSAIDSLLSEDFFKSAQIAIDVYDLTADEYLYRKNEKLLMRPASNLKLLTSTAALIFLGPDYKFNTSFYHTGNIIDSVCTGDLFVVGGGDPDFTLAELDSLVGLIWQSGIKKINGNLYGDVSLLDSLYWGKGWMWDDNPHLFSPYFSPMIINKSGVKIISGPGEPGEKVNVTVEPKSDFYTLINEAYTIDFDTSKLKVTRDWINNKNDIIVSGEMYQYAEADTTELNLIHPEKYFLTLLTESLNRNGIEFCGLIDTLSLPAEAQLILAFERSLSNILIEMNKESYNLSAEMVLRMLGYEKSGKPVNLNDALSCIDSLITLTGFDPDNYRIVDGSGLSFYNLISAEVILETLKYLYQSKLDYYRLILDSLPVAGVSGTLEDRMKDKPLCGNVRAKTGSISGISALSGYLNSVNKHDIAFSILIQNFVGSPKTAHDYQEKICEFIYEMK